LQKWTLGAADIAIDKLKAYADMMNGALVANLQEVTQVYIEGYQYMFVPAKILNALEDYKPESYANIMKQPVGMDDPVRVIGKMNFAEFAQTHDNGLAVMFYYNYHALITNSVNQADAAMISALRCIGVAVGLLAPYKHRSIDVDEVVEMPDDADLTKIPAAYK
jgi:hypothetical protein